MPIWGHQSYWTPQTLSRLLTKLVYTFKVALARLEKMRFSCCMFRPSSSGRALINMPLALFQSASP